MRCAPIVHADETGWRIDGRNCRLWTITSDDKTVFHVDKSRGGTVIQSLLGKAFGGTLVSDFYSAYSKMDCKKQKRLAHLLQRIERIGGKISGVCRLKVFHRLQTADQTHAAAQTAMGNIGRQTLRRESPQV